MSFRTKDHYQNHKTLPKLNHKGGNIYGNANIVNGDLTINGSPLVPVGTVISYISNEAPGGWLNCDGTQISKSKYNRLYNIIGDSFGIPDISTNFVLPDLRGRIPLGSGQGLNLTNRIIGSNGGEETHTLTENEMPTHNHTATIDNSGEHSHNINDPGHNHSLNMVEKDDGNFSNVDGQYPTGDAVKNYGNDHNVTVTNSTTNIKINNSGSHTHNITLNNTGGNQPHNNMQPFLVLNYIIRY
jgi:microcystin-dependent protein